jgi:iron complex transport system permease protein
MIAGHVPSQRRVGVVAAVLVVALLISVVVGLAIGPTAIPLWSIVRALGAKVGIGHSTLTSLQSTIVWQLRAPRMVLGLLAGSMLAIAGGTYQGVFRNPLADPYLLGVAAGAGLGATIAIVGFAGGGDTPTWTPLLAFAGALGAVAVTWLIGGRGRRTNSSTLILAGVAVASLLTSVQTFVQQSNSTAIARVYIWLLGSLASASWSSVFIVLPYVVVCSVICVAAGRALDVLSVGDEESRSLGLPVNRVRLLVVMASSLGTAAVVSVAGLIGFVGIVVPHIVRLLVGVSYRRILPLSLIGGGAFLVLADTVARTVFSPSELPLGVVTAIVGAPIFVVILASRKVVTV